MSQSNAEANRLMEEQSLGGIGGWADLDDDGPDDYDEAAEYEAIMDEATAVLDQMADALKMPRGESNG